VKGIGLFSISAVQMRCLAHENAGVGERLELADLARNQQRFPRREDWLESNWPKPLAWSWRYDRLRANGRRSFACI
jgi:hypothetical protein